MRLKAIREARNKIEMDYATLCLLDYDENFILTDTNIDVYAKKVMEVLSRTHIYLDIESTAVAVMKLGLEASIDDLVYKASEVMALIS